MMKPETSSLADLSPFGTGVWGAIRTREECVKSAVNPQSVGDALKK